MILHELDFVFTDPAEELLPISAVEGRQPRQHFVEYDAEAPPVAGEAVISPTRQNLRSQVLCRAYETVSLALSSRDVLFRQAKVCE